MLYATQVIPLIPLTYALIHYFFLLSFLENCRLFSKTKAINAAFLAKLRGLPTLCFPRYLCSWRNVYRFSLDFYITLGCEIQLKWFVSGKYFYWVCCCFVNFFLSMVAFCVHILSEKCLVETLLIYCIWCVSFALLENDICLNRFDDLIYVSTINFNHFIY